jgi:hypothetical protein
MGRWNDGKGGLAHREEVREDDWYRQVGAVRSTTDLCSAQRRRMKTYHKSTTNGLTFSMVSIQFGRAPCCYK